MPEGYCVKERKKVEIKDAKQVTMKNGRPAIQGLPGLRHQNLQDRQTRVAPSRADLNPACRRRVSRVVTDPSCECRPDGRAQTDERDVREAYAAHAGELYGFAVRSLGDSGLAEEAVQETFLRAWRAGERFDPQIGSLRTWLFAILRNVVIDLGRARAARPRRRRGRDRALGRAASTRRCSPGRSRRRCGGSATQHRRVLVETYYRGRPYAEVAEELGVPEGTVKSRVYYGLRALRVVLEEMGYED